MKSFSSIKSNNTPQKKLAYGINKRCESSRKRSNNVFDEDGSGSESDNDVNDAHREIGNHTNNEIAAEQRALRRRAEAAVANESVGTSIYNYDNEYDEFSSSLQKQRDETIQKNKSQTFIKTCLFGIWTF